MGALNTDDGNDTITGSGNFSGILLSGYSSTFETGKGDDVIYGCGGDAGIINENTNILNTDDGKNIIFGSGFQGIVKYG